jgi:5-methylcytosine-specific restriction endonuclease McrA
VALIPDSTGFDIEMFRLPNDSFKPRVRSTSRAVARALMRRQKWPETTYAERAYRRIDPVIRAMVLRRARQRCEDCGRSWQGCGGLALHHLTYRYLEMELPDNLRALCRNCHENRHFRCGRFIGDPEARALRR